MASKRLMTGKVAAAIATGAAAAVLGAWGTHIIGPRTEVPQPNVSSETEQPANQVIQASYASEVKSDTLLAESRISFADWQALVKQTFGTEQRKSIFERYRGERVTWQGYVDAVNRISTENGGTSSAQFILVLYEDRETLDSQALGRAPALCTFPRDAEYKLDKLQHGQHVVVQGTFAAQTLHGQLLGTRLYNCKLIGTP